MSSAHDTRDDVHPSPRGGRDAGFAAGALPRSAPSWPQTSRWRSPSTPQTSRPYHHTAPTSRCQPTLTSRHHRSPRSRPHSTLTSRRHRSPTLTSRQRYPSPSARRCSPRSRYPRLDRLRVAEDIPTLPPLSAKGLVRQRHQSTIPILLRSVERKSHVIGSLQQKLDAQRAENLVLHTDCRRLKMTLLAVIDLWNDQKAFLTQRLASSPSDGIVTTHTPPPTNFDLPSNLDAVTPTASLTKNQLAVPLTATSLTQHLGSSTEFTTPLDFDFVTITTPTPSDMQPTSSTEPKEAPEADPVTTITPTPSNMQVTSSPASPDEAQPTIATTSAPPPSHSKPTKDQGGLPSQFTSSQFIPCMRDPIQKKRN